MLFHRIRTLCSDPDDIKLRIKDFYRRLLQRGHKRDTILPLFRKALTKPLDGNSPRTTTENSLFFHLQYHPNDLPSSAIQRQWCKLFSECSFGLPLHMLTNQHGNRIPIDRLIVCYSRPPNLGNLLSYRQLQVLDGPPVSSYRRITNSEGLVTGQSPTGTVGTHSGSPRPTIQTRLNHFFSSNS